MVICGVNVVESPFERGDTELDVWSSLLVVHIIADSLPFKLEL